MTQFPAKTFEELNTSSIEDLGNKNVYNCINDYENLIRVANFFQWLEENIECSGKFM